jgi:hypothetical protein
MEMIKKYQNKPWNWTWISRNPTITMEFIEKHPDKPWNWTWISKNPNITMEMIENHPEKPWSWYFISQNPNVTMEMIEKYPNKSWEWSCISLNEFKKDKEKFIEKKLKEHLSAFRIQQHWFNAKMNPEYSLCKKMVGDFYDNVIMARFM